MLCRHEGCEKPAEEGRDECFKHRVSGIRFALRGSAVQGDFHKTAREWKEEHLGTSDDRELARRGIERVS